MDREQRKVIKEILDTRFKPVIDDAFDNLLKQLDNKDHKPK